MPPKPAAGHGPVGAAPGTPTPETLASLTARIEELESLAKQQSDEPRPRQLTYGKLVSPGPFSLPHSRLTDENLSSRTYTKLKCSLYPTGFVRCDPNNPPEGLKGVKPADVPTFQGTDFPEFSKLALFNFMAGYDPILTEALLAVHDEHPTKAHNMSTQRQALQLLKSALSPYQPAADLLLLVPYESKLPAADAWSMVHTHFTRGILLSLGRHLRTCISPQYSSETAISYIHRVLLARENCHSILPNCVSDDLASVLILTGLSSMYASTAEKLCANYLDTVPFIDEIRTMILLNQGYDNEHLPKTYSNPQQTPPNPPAGSPAVLTTAAPSSKTPPSPCFHCDQPGHWAWACPNPKDPVAFASWKKAREERRFKARYPTAQTPNPKVQDNPTVQISSVPAGDSSPHNDLFGFDYSG